MNPSVQLMAVFCKNRRLFLILLAAALTISAAASIAVAPLYESTSVLSIGKNIRMGQIYFTPEAGWIFDKNLRIHVDSPRYVEDAGRLAARILGRYGSDGPIFSPPSRPYVYDAKPIRRWEETLELKVRAATGEEAAAFARKIFEDVSREHAELIGKNRDSISRLLELARDEREAIESLPPSPERVINRMLVEERVARFSQQLDEFIEDSRIVMEPEAGIKKVRPRPLTYAVAGVFAAVVATIVLVILFDWVKSLYALWKKSV